MNIYSEYKNMVYVATQSEYQILMGWRIINENFEPNIQHIYVVDNIVAVELSRLPSNISQKNRQRQARINIVKTCYSWLVRILTANMVPPYISC